MAVPSLPKIIKGVPTFLHSGSPLPRRPLPNPEQRDQKFARPLGEIAGKFRPQFETDDCLVAALEGIHREFFERRGIALKLDREELKGLCGYSHGTGSNASKMVPNFNVHLRNARVAQWVEAKESIGSETTFDSLHRICEEETTSFPIVGVGKRYWDIQTHIKLPREREMDHALVVLKASTSEVIYYDPLQRPGSPSSPAEKVHSMPYVLLSQIENEALMAQNWMFWLAQTGWRPTLEAFPRGVITNA